MLQETICLVEISKITQYENELLTMVRRLFKRIHEVLYEIEDKKKKQIDKMLFERFGQRVNLEEIKSL